MPESAQAILYKAHEYGITGKGWSWISTRWVDEDLYNIEDEKYKNILKEALEGSIGVSPYAGDIINLVKKISLYYYENLDYCKKLISKCGLDELDFSENDLTPYVSNTYDAINVVAESFLINSDQSLYFDTIKDRTFSGITGDIRFDENFDRIPNFVDIINIKVYF